MPMLRNFPKKNSWAKCDLFSTPIQLKEENGFGFTCKLNDWFSTV